MGWVRLDDQFPQHPKVIGIGPLGIAMQIAGLCYCNRYLTDGFVPESAIPTLLDFRELDQHAFNGVGGVCWMAVEKLVSSGIWERVGGGYNIHDYLFYQPSKARVLKERELNRARQGRFRNTESNAVSNAGVTPLVTQASLDSNAVSNELLRAPRTRTRTQSQVPSTNTPSISPPKGETHKPRKSSRRASSLKSGERGDLELGGGKPRARSQNASHGLLLKRARPFLTDPEVAAIHQTYDGDLGTTKVDFEIASALDHQAAIKRGKSGSWNLYVRNWLNRTVKEAKHGAGESRRHAAADGDTAEADGSGGDGGVAASWDRRKGGAERNAAALREVRGDRVVEEAGGPG